ncbi:hypothetical protein D9758_006008 [Tetrapyrgos nigripes]|uniref:Serine hydrolase domain-containing protein n=1 Tax=Tetrapyrgos nigripes TaxID=182062 RepID=A0A8H5D8P8_9AGAR|nr:hypothetical protein D9758_006008 [Tetrapyrgos nigripes]
MQSTGKRRILMLHGHGQCAYTMSRLFASTISECDQEIDFVFLDAPTALVPVDFAHDHVSSASIADTPGPLKPTLTPAYPPTSRAWFKIQNFTIDQETLHLSLMLLKEVFREHRFEAIVGFSQGAAIAEMIAAMLEQPHLYPEFCENGKAPHPPLKYVVACAGFLLRGPCTEWGATVGDTVELDPKYFINTPVLHILGRTDVVVPRERSDLFMAHSFNKRIEEHVGGHFIPTAPRWRQFFIDFFRDPFAEIKSPSTSRKRQSYMPLPKAANDTVLPAMPIGETLPRPSFTEAPPVKPTRPTIQTIVTNFDAAPAKEPTPVQEPTRLTTPIALQRPARPSIVSFAVPASATSSKAFTPTWTPDSPFEGPPTPYVSMAGAFVPDPEDDDISTPESAQLSDRTTPSDSFEQQTEPETSLDVKNYSVAGRIYQGLLVAAGFGRSFLRAPIP